MCSLPVHKDIVPFKKKLLSVVLAASMVISLAACGGGGDAQPAETQTTTETKEDFNS